MIETRCGFAGDISVMVYHPADMDVSEAYCYVMDELAKNIPYRLYRVDITYRAGGELVVRAHYETSSMISRTPDRTVCLGVGVAGGD